MEQQRGETKSICKAKKKRKRVRGVGRGGEGMKGEEGGRATDGGGDQ